MKSFTLEELKFLREVLDTPGLVMQRPRWRVAAMVDEKLTDLIADHEQATAEKAGLTE